MVVIYKLTCEMGFKFSYDAIICEDVFLNKYYEYYSSVCSDIYLFVNKRQVGEFTCCWGISMTTQTSGSHKILLNLEVLF